MISRPSARILWIAPALWIVPLWVIPYLPMVDYPQQLAMASVLRYYGDPARHLQEAYQLALLRPQGLFEIVTAGLGWLMPIEAAGRLVLSLCLALVVPAAVALCRRAGQPDWYSLFALAVTYNHAFYWGFVDNLAAYPLVLAGGALADRLFDRRFGVREWLLVAGCGVLFYGIHLQFLLIYVGFVAWLALARRPGLRELAVQLSALVPGLALGAGVLAWAHLHHGEVMTGYQDRLQALPPYYASLSDKIRQMPERLFGNYTGGEQHMMMAVLLLTVLALSVPFPRREGVDWREGLLFRSRFLVPALGLLVLFFMLPEFARGYFVSERLIPLTFMMLVPCLPVPGRARWRSVALLLGGLLVLQLGQTLASFVRFGDESAGLRELLASAEPGQPLAGLMYQKAAFDWESPPVMIHFPAYYQVEKGGRIHFSFVQFFNSPLRYRQGRNWEDGLLAEWDEWNPQRFSYPRHGRHFRYFLLRGGPENLAAAFGPYLSELRVRSAGRWYLVERRDSRNVILPKAR